ncbi:MAG TPA: hypothetical protein VFP85_11235 [Vicinamibacterales bacterium]|jgi:hypothetical protein|nr:hypothetical protein [Vicinamibacterales bacterium]
MKLHQRTVALAAAIGFLIAPAAFAQTPAPAAPAQPAAPRKLISPLRGEATVEFTNPNTQRKGANIITMMTVKNTSSGPIAGFRIEESWADKTGNLAGGDVYRHPRPFMPGEVIQVTLTTPANTRMASNSFNFVHANGTVKPKRVPKIDVPKTDPPKTE